MDDPKTIKSPGVQRKDRIPPGQSCVAELPVLHEGPVPAIDPDQWTLSIFGAIKHPHKITYRELLGAPRVKVHSDVHCVTGWSKLDNLGEGVSTRELKNLVAANSEAKFVMVHAHGGYSTNLSLDDFFAADVLFALEHDGRAIEPRHGHPIRLVVPGLYLWKSAKWVAGVEFMAEDKPGFRESRGYHNTGDPWQEQRYAEQIQ